MGLGVDPQGETDDAKAWANRRDEYEELEVLQDSVNVEVVDDFKTRTLV